MAALRGRYQTAHVTDDMPTYSHARYLEHRSEILARRAADRRARGVLTVAERKAASAARAARFCRTCGEQLADRKRRYCSTACRIAANPEVARHNGLLATTRELVCARPGCEVAFASRKANRRYCSEACHRMATFDRAGRGKGRRFPRVRYAQRRRILERDGWTCQLCHAPIDPKLTFPHPGSASIDHRDPDGEHVDANLQAAHLGCNVEKGRKHHLGAAA